MVCGNCFSVQLRIHKHISKYIQYQRYLWDQHGSVTQCYWYLQFIYEAFHKDTNVESVDMYLSVFQWHDHGAGGNQTHYGDVIMGAIASQITSLTIVYTTVNSDPDQRKHQSSTSLAFLRGIYREPRTNGQLRGKCFHLMTSSWSNDWIKPSTCARCRITSGGYVYLSPGSRV